MRAIRKNKYGNCSNIVLLKYYSLVIPINTYSCYLLDDSRFFRDDLLDRCNFVNVALFDSNIIFREDTSNFSISHVSPIIPVYALDGNKQKLLFSIQIISINRNLYEMCVTAF